MLYKRVSIDRLYLLTGFSCDVTCSLFAYSCRGDLGTALSGDQERGWLWDLGIPLASQGLGVLVCLIRLSNGF